ncbi:nuclease, EndA/NucM family [delta proteobacterium NaphS2]|nr:nuclease, EndA/NucM family [delta proteobacterium NaphS2]
MKMIKSLLIPLALALLFVLPCQAVDKGNTTNDSFNKAKKILLRDVYLDHRTTFYCGYPFNSQKQILPCGNYTPKKEGKRAHRLEWEHIVPAHAFGQSVPEWRNGHPECVASKGKPFKGRNCARKMAPELR